MHGIADEGKQVTISPEEVCSILPSPDNNFKEKNAWIATLNTAEVVDQMENKFLDAQTLTVIPPSHLEDIQYEDEETVPVMKLKIKYHHELPKKERMLRTPKVKKLLRCWPKFKTEDDLLLRMSPLENRFVFHRS